MERSSHIYQTYVEILRRELICAMGCTEPVAIAYCAAKARAILGVLPERMKVCASECCATDTAQEKEQQLTPEHIPA